MGTSDTTNARRATDSKQNRRRPVRVPVRWQKNGTAKAHNRYPSGEAILFPSCSFLTRGLVARIGTVAAGAIALVTACAPAEPPVRSTDEEPAVALVSAPSAAMVTSARVTSADTRLGELIENTPGSVVAGERLNVELLRRFYARHGFAPVWTTRQGQAEFTDQCRVARRRSWPRPRAVSRRCAAVAGNIAGARPGTVAVGRLPVLCRRAGARGHAGRAPKG